MTPTHLQKRHAAAPGVFSGPLQFIHSESWSRDNATLLRLYRGSRACSVYTATKVGQAPYVGMTCRDVMVWAAEHLFESDSVDGLIGGLSNAEARAVEHTLIDTLKGGGNLLNKINSISQTSDPEYYTNSIFRGLELLQQAGYAGF